MGVGRARVGGRVLLVGLQIRPELGARGREIDRRFEREIFAPRADQRIGEPRPRAPSDRIRAQGAQGMAGPSPGIRGVPAEREPVAADGLGVAQARLAQLARIVRHGGEGQRDLLGQAQQIAVRNVARQRPRSLEFRAAIVERDGGGDRLFLDAHADVRSARLIARLQRARRGHAGEIAREQQAAFDPFDVHRPPVERAAQIGADALAHRLGPAVEGDPAQIAFDDLDPERAVAHALGWDEGAREHETVGAVARFDLFGRFDDRRQTDRPADQFAVILGERFRRIDRTALDRNGAHFEAQLVHRPALGRAGLRGDRQFQIGLRHRDRARAQTRFRRRGDLPQILGEQRRRRQAKRKARQTDRKRTRVRHHKIGFILIRGIGESPCYEKGNPPLLHRHKGSGIER